MRNKKSSNNARSLVLIALCLCLFLSVMPVASSAAGSKTYVDGKIYEFEKDNEYKFSETTSYKSTANGTTYGRFSICGNDSELSADGKKNGVPAYTVEEGKITISYTYSDELLNASNDEWHLIEDKEKHIDLYELESNIQKGAFILQRSIDRLNWSDVSIQTNVFENTPKQNAAMYETLDVELINGCYYRLIVVYKLSRLADSSKVLWVFTDEDYEYKRVAEVYEFYAEVDNEYIQDLQANTKKYRLGETVKVSDFESYSGTQEITKDDIHYNWNLGDFFVSGFTSARENNGQMIIEKNVGDVVTLWFNLEQNIDALNNNPDLTITADVDGHDQYFQTVTTNFGRGMLIVRKTDSENKKHDPVMYYNFLEANTSLGANTRVQLFEEGDYEVALDYEVTKDQLVDKVGHYRIFFKFSIRNANTMFYLFDQKTNNELSNGSVTPNGFRLDLARSQYLNVYIEKEIWTEGAEGLTKDTRFNTTAKDGDVYTDEGIYTITVENQYNGLKTTKTIYVGTNRILTAYMTSNYSLAEIQELVAKGAVIYEDGTIEMPPETYSVTYEFVSGTTGMSLPDAVNRVIPLNQANNEDGAEVIAGTISETEISVTGGVWKFQGWDADKKVIDCADQVFIGTWLFIGDTENETTPESGTDTISELEDGLPKESVGATTPSESETVVREENLSPTDETKNSNWVIISIVAIVALAAGMFGFVLSKKKNGKREGLE